MVFLEPPRVGPLARGLYLDEADKGAPCRHRVVGTGLESREGGFSDSDNLPRFEEENLRQVRDQAFERRPELIFRRTRRAAAGKLQLERCTKAGHGVGEWSSLRQARSRSTRSGRPITVGTKVAMCRRSVEKPIPRGCQWHSNYPIGGIRLTMLSPRGWQHFRLGVDDEPPHYERLAALDPTSRGMKCFIGFATALRNVPHDAGCRPPEPQRTAVPRKARAGQRSEQSGVEPCQSNQTQTRSWRCRRNLPTRFRQA